MHLTVLVDNNTFIDQYFIGEPALSIYLEAEGKKILFDTGYSDAFLVNARRLGIDLTKLDILVLSHGHLDHTWGLSYLVKSFSEARWMGKKVKRPLLVAHPMVFADRSFQSDPEIGSLLKEDVLSRFFDLKLTKEPFPLTDKLLFLGEINRENDFEAQEAIGMIRQEGRDVPDMVMDDSALAYQTRDGLVIITGCSHAGICNIVEQAKKLTGEARVLDVIGGLHLLQPSTRQIQGTKDYLFKLDLREVHACHCTDLQSKFELAKVVNLKEVGTGMRLRF